MHDLHPRHFLVSGSCYQGWISLQITCRNCNHEVIKSKCDCTDTEDDSESDGDDSDEDDGKENHNDDDED